MPAWIDFVSGIFGVPDLEGRGLKVGIDAHGSPFDPDTGDRQVDDNSVETARAWLRRRFPSMSAAPLVESRVCQYENTASGDFLIDRHPEHENVWLAGGGSGHGFKHGPAVGEYVAGLIAGKTTPEAAFAFATKGTIHAARCLLKSKRRERTLLPVPIVRPASIPKQSIGPHPFEASLSIRHAQTTRSDSSSS